MQRRDNDSTADDDGRRPLIDTDKNKSYLIPFVKMILFGIKHIVFGRAAVEDEEVRPGGRGRAAAAARPRPLWTSP